MSLFNIQTKIILDYFKLEMILVIKFKIENMTLINASIIIQIYTTYTGPCIRSSSSKSSSTAGVIGSRPGSDFDSLSFFSWSRCVYN